MDKVSIRFYKDHEVRAVWSKEGNELVSATNQLRLRAAVGKLNYTDMKGINYSYYYEQAY